MTVEVLRIIKNAGSWRKNAISKVLNVVFVLIYLDGISSLWKKALFRGKHTDWFQEFFSNNSLFWTYNLELSNSRFVWPFIYLKSPRNFRKPHGKFSEPFYIENTKFHFNIMTEISTFFGSDFLSHWIPLNFCLKYLCNWQLMYARTKIFA